jgi:5-methylcytosine-specific restriction enzyme A
MGLKLCNYPGCKSVISSGGYCPEHRPEAKPNPGKKFLDSSAWKKMRLAKITETPWCEVCDGPATDVDHILPRHSHPELSLAWGNLQSLCRSCHSKKTENDEKRSRRSA